MLKKVPEVAKINGWRKSIAFREPQISSFSADKKVLFPGKANSVVLVVMICLALVVMIYSVLVVMICSVLVVII